MGETAKVDHRAGDGVGVVGKQEGHRLGHIFAGGYAAGYYSYLWSDVLCADCFSAFEEAGLDNDAKVAQIGRRFRDTFLALGGGEDPAVVFEQFRGRGPATDAFLRINGLG